MAIRKTAYDTTVGKSINISELNDQIENILGDDSAIVELVPGKVIGIIASNEVGSFTLPYDFEKDRETLFVVDLRKAMKRENIYETKITNQGLYNLVASTGILTAEWNLMGSKYITGLGNLPMLIFCKMISENMSKNYVINMQDKMIIEVVTALYYMNLSNAELKFDETEIGDVIAKINRVLKYPVNSIENIITSLANTPNNVNELALAFYDLTQNVNLKTFNSTALLTILKSAWFGHDAKFIIACSLEHPPTWVGMLYSAMKERLYKQTGITKLAEVHGKQDKKAFVTAVDHLIASARN